MRVFFLTNAVGLCENLAIVSDNPCRACDTFSKFEQISEHFDECSNCGVFKNEVDLMVANGYGGEINTDWSLLRKDIEKFIPILTQIEDLRKGKKGALIDVASSTGYLVWLAKLRGWSATGVDIKPQAAVKAQEIFGVHVHICEFEDSDIYEDGATDCVVFHHGIEHLSKPRKAIEKALKVLKKDGLIYLQHPVMQKSYELARNHVSSGHQYEWTFEAFWAFLNQFPVQFVYRSEGEYRGGSVPPSQTWIIVHENSNSVLPRD